MSCAVLPSPRLAFPGRPCSQACAGAEMNSLGQPEPVAFPGSQILELDALPGAGGATTLAVALSSAWCGRASGGGHRDPAVSLAWSPNTVCFASLDPNERQWAVSLHCTSHEQSGLDNPQPRHVEDFERTMVGEAPSGQGPQVVSCQRALPALTRFGIFSVCH